MLVQKGSLKSSAPGCLATSWTSKVSRTKAWLVALNTALDAALGFVEDDGQVLEGELKFDSAEFEDAGGNP